METEVYMCFDTVRGEKRS